MGFYIRMHIRPLLPGARFQTGNLRAQHFHLTVNDAVKKSWERSGELLVLICYGRNGSELAYVHLNLVHTIWEIVLEGPVNWDHFFINFTFSHLPIRCQRSVQNLTQTSGLCSFKGAVINYDQGGGGGTIQKIL